MNTEGRVRAERRLAAILAADVAGYSRLIGADEEGTLERLKAIRSELIDPKIAEHHGRLVKTTGDGLLVEFSSVVDALRCATEIQREMVERNSGVVVSERIDFRIGVHQGDIVVEDGDIFGDGVNVAARLEALAEPGGICVSARVQEDVAGRLDLTFDDLGEQSVKNIVRPIRTYALSADAVAALPRAEEPAAPRPTPPMGPRYSRRWLTASHARRVLIIALGGGKQHDNCANEAALFAPMDCRPRCGRHPDRRWWSVVVVAFGGEGGGSGVVGWSGRRRLGAGSAPRLSMVVLPFANLSSDPEQEYFADAVTGDLTTDLSRIKDSFVIAHTTAVTYKGKPLDVKQISRDLGVHYVLEGSVQRLGERIQVNVQLLDGESGAHVWADRLDTDCRDLAEAQGEITGRLARMLNTELIRDVGRRIEQERGADPDARDLVMRARALWMQGYSAEINKKVLDLSERALAIDRGSVDARIAVGRTLAAGISDSFSNDVEKDQARAEQLLLEALDRDPNRSSAHEAMGLLRRVQGRWAESQGEFKKAIALDRNDPWAIRQLGMTVLIQGKPESAIPYLENSIRLDPYAPNLFIAYLHLGNAYLFLGHTDQAIELLRKAEVANPSIWYVHLALAGALGLRGDVDEARREIAEVLKLKPDANSFARLRAIGATSGFGSPQFGVLSEKTVNASVCAAPVSRRNDPAGPSPPNTSLIEPVG